MGKKQGRVAASMLIAMQAGGAGAESPAQVDQIQLPGSSEAPSVTASQVPVARPARNGAVNQLPRHLEPLRDDDAPPPPPTPHAASRDMQVREDITRAIETIRGRGQQPTPELIAREIGPDAITAFLNDNPGKAGVLVGTEDPNPPKTDGQPAVTAPE